MKIRTHPPDQADTSNEQLLIEEFPGGQAKIKEISVPLKSEIIGVEKRGVILFCSNTGSYTFISNIEYLP